MKQIVKYEANDGAIFDDEKTAQKYERILAQVNSLPFADYEDDDCSFANGGGYIQQTEYAVKEAEEVLIRLTNEWFEPAEPFKNPRGIVGRWLDDSGMKALSKLYSRLCCIDSEYREWGQPYFANNPGKGENKQLN